MASSTLPLAPAKAASTFQKGLVLPVVVGHFVHDLYTSTLAPLLPLLIEKFSLSLTQAGMLQFFLQIPAVLNPMFGFLADRGGGRYFVILAPAVTGTLMSLIGFAPNYAALALLLLCAGVSTAAFHAPGPAIIGRAAGRRLGLGMSLFMVGGETAYTVGPLLTVWVVSTWTLDGFWRIIVLGWAASLVLYWRFGRGGRSGDPLVVGVEPDQKSGASARSDLRASLRALAPGARSIFLPLAILNLFSGPLLAFLSTFLPTYMTERGATLWLAGAALSIYQLAGIPGVLLSGTLSDRLGRRKVLAIATLFSAGLALIFQNLSGWLAVPVLLVLGFFALSTLPVMMAIVQEHFPEQRATANGIYMMLSFVLRTVGALIVGILGDKFGLQTAFTISAVISLLAIPAILALPGRKS